MNTCLTCPLLGSFFTCAPTNQSSGVTTSCTNETALCSFETFCNTDNCNAPAGKFDLENSSPRGLQVNNGLVSLCLLTALFLNFVFSLVVV